MKSIPNKKERFKKEKEIKRMEDMLSERGSKALEEARNRILREKIECEEAQGALAYFMNEYWRDLARPTLVSLACEAIGGDPDAIAPVTVPLILIGGAIDVHDDVIDESKVKGARSTVLGKFGKEVALLVGDALLFEGFFLLHEAIRKGISVKKISVIAGLIQRMFFELGDAEALELRFRGRIDVTPEEYLTVVRMKAADVEAHTRISAALGEGTKIETEALGKYGRLLGMMIILGDDLMDMIDLRELTHRVKNESLPLPLLCALQDPKIRSLLTPILLKRRITKINAKKILEVTENAGGLEQVKRIMQELARESVNQIRGKLKTTVDLELLTNYVLRASNIGKYN